MSIKYCNVDVTLIHGRRIVLSKRNQASKSSLSPQGDTARQKHYWVRHTSSELRVRLKTKRLSITSVTIVVPWKVNEVFSLQHLFHQTNCYTTAQLSRLKLPNYNLKSTVVEFMKIINIANSSTFVRCQKPYSRTQSRPPNDVLAISFNR